MFFSKSCEYALRATIYLAKVEGNQKVGIKIIAGDLNLPADYLNKVLQKLVRYNIVSSTKGRNGGFYISDSEINKPLIRIIHAIDGKEVFKKCGMGIKNCSDRKPCPLHENIKAYRDNLQLALSINSLALSQKQIEDGEAFLFK